MIEIDTYEKALIEKANGMLRSAYQIAKRDGEKTNWEAFRNQVMLILEEQHKYLYPVEDFTIKG
jgi:hypothetical protein